MVNLKMHSKGLDRRSAALQRSPAMMQASQHRALLRIGRLLVPMLRADSPKGATGRLRNTTGFHIQRFGSRQRLVIRQAARSQSGHFYGVSVRSGTGPHWPPVRELIPWVRAVLRVSAADAPRVAYLVARKIARRGTRPNPYHQRVFRRAQGAIRAILREEMVSVVARLRR
jgi:hypothetical protein